MFDIGASELLVIVIIAIIVIGPKELPLALRTAGRWIGKIRRASSHFRTGLDAMIREAELEDMDRKWKEQNDAIMAKYPATDNADTAADADGSNHTEEMVPLDPPASVTPAADADAVSRNEKAAKPASSDEPSLPFDAAKGGS